MKMLIHAVKGYGEVLIYGPSKRKNIPGITDVRKKYNFLFYDDVLVLMTKSNITYQNKKKKAIIHKRTLDIAVDLNLIFKTAKAHFIEIIC